MASNKIQTSCAAAFRYYGRDRQKQQAIKVKDLITNHHCGDLGKYIQKTM